MVHPPPLTCTLRRQPGLNMHPTRRRPKHRASAQQLRRKGYTAGCTQKPAATAAPHHPEHCCVKSVCVDMY